MSRGGLRERHRGRGGRREVRGGDLGKSRKRESENGDTCVFVDAILSSVAFFGVAAPGWGGGL